MLRTNLITAILAGALALCSAQDSMSTSTVVEVVEVTAVSTSTVYATSEVTIIHCDNGDTSCPTDSTVLFTAVTAVSTTLCPLTLTSSRTTEITTSVGSIDARPVIGQSSSQSSTVNSPVVPTPPLGVEGDQTTTDTVTGTQTVISTIVDAPISSPITRSSESAQSLAQPDVAQGDLQGFPSSSPTKPTAISTSPGGTLSTPSASSAPEVTTEFPAGVPQGSVVTIGTEDTIPALTQTSEEGILAGSTTPTDGVSTASVSSAPIQASASETSAPVVTSAGADSSGVSIQGSPSSTSSLASPPDFTVPQSNRNTKSLTTEQLRSSESLGQPASLTLTADSPQRSPSESCVGPPESCPPLSSGGNSSGASLSAPTTPFTQNETLASTVTTTREQSPIPGAPQSSSPGASAVPGGSNRTSELSGSVGVSSSDSSHFYLSSSITSEGALSTINVEAPNGPISWDTSTTDLSPNLNAVGTDSAHASTYGAQESGSAGESTITRTVEFVGSTGHSSSLGFKTPIVDSSPGSRNIVPQSSSADSSGMRASSVTGGTATTITLGQGSGSAMPTSQPASSNMPTTRPPQLTSNEGLLTPSDSGTLVSRTKESALSALASSAFASLASESTFSVVTISLPSVTTRVQQAITSFTTAVITVLCSECPEGQTVINNVIPVTTMTPNSNMSDVSNDSAAVGNGTSIPANFTMGAGTAASGTGAAATAGSNMSSPSFTATPSAFFMNGAEPKTACTAFRPMMIFVIGMFVAMFLEA